MQACPGSTTTRARRRGEAPQKPTTEVVRKWYLDADPSWPLQEDRWFVTLASVCDQERDRHAMEMRNASVIQESRRRWQALRAANDVVMDEMPATIEELGKQTPGEPSELTAGRRRLLALLEAGRTWHEAAKRAKSALERIRDPGGQPRPRVAFARRVAKHVLSTWGQQGFHERSLHADGPFVGFLALILDDVYGGEADHEALARSLRRDKDLVQLIRQNRT
jgi:hypothetical protein